MTVDLSNMLPTIIVAVIGFLIRHAFKEFGDKLVSIANDVKDVREAQQEQGERVTVVETVLKQKGYLT